MTTVIYELPSLDQAMFGDLRADLGDDSIESLAAMFAGRSAQLEQIVEASRLRQGARLARLAHSLRGGAAMLGASRLTVLAQQLEDRGLANSLVGAESLAAEATAEFDRAVAEMSAVLEGDRVA
ncbi:MAG: Hpt domain-containing protein [Solirubrobacterales bacterium]